MGLLEREFLLIDCQTTGMRPSSGHLLEIAWSVVRADSSEPLKKKSFLVRLPEGAGIPRRVTEITGLTDADLAEAVEPAEILRLLQQDLGRLDWALIHYAQFEKPFLTQLFGLAPDEPLPFEVLCTHQLAKKLLPRLPSQNIRGLAGHFGAKFHEFKRAASHVQATHEIWRGLAPMLAQKEIETPQQIRKWMSAQPKTKAEPYEYRIDRLTRLDLPEKPGIYKMLAKSGEVLYVGKATSLRDRVNSYFRGRKGRDRRKLEMLAQVWDLEVTECPTALEAALLESDEIKRLNPPYNISLKTGRRGLCFYSRDFTQSSPVQDENHPQGPFRPMNAIEQLRLLADSLASGEFRQIFYVEVDPLVLAEGFEIFKREQGADSMQFTDLRKSLAFAQRLWRRHQALPVTEEEATSTDEAAGLELEETKNEEKPWTPQEAAEKFENAFLRAAEELQRARRMTNLLCARVRWQTKDGLEHELLVRNGKTAAAPQEPELTPNENRTPWLRLGLQDYDRMSILLSEISKYPHSFSRERANLREK